MTSSVFSCGFANKENKFFFGTSEGKLGIYQYNNMWSIIIFKNKKNLIKKF